MIEKIGLFVMALCLAHALSSTHGAWVTDEFQIIHERLDEIQAKLDQIAAD